MYYRKVSDDTFQIGENKGNCMDVWFKDGAFILRPVSIGLDLCMTPEEFLMMSKIMFMDELPENLPEKPRVDLVLVEWSSDYGRHGSLDGQFICTRKDYERISSDEIHLGEVLGKHSDVSVNFASRYASISIANDNPYEIQFILEMFGDHLSGYDLLERASLDHLESLDVGDKYEFDYKCSWYEEDSFDEEGCYLG